MNFIGHLNLLRPHATDPVGGTSWRQRKAKPDGYSVTESWALIGLKDVFNAGVPLHIIERKPCGYMVEFSHLPEGYRVPDKAMEKFGEDAICMTGNELLLSLSKEQMEALAEPYQMHKKRVIGR